MSTPKHSGSGDSAPATDAGHGFGGAAGRRLRWRVGSAALLVVAPVVAYHNSFAGKFIFDDFSNVKNNYKLRTLWPIWETMWGPLGAGVSGRPVVQLSFALNYAVHGLELYGYHAVNLVLHILTALVLFGTLRRTLLTAPLAPRFGARATLLAFVATLIWEVHPLLSDSVSYISGRTEVLGALFLLLTLYCAIRANTSPRRTQAWTVAAVISCMLGTGCKEILVAAPMLVLLFDRLFFFDTFAEAWRRRRGLYAGLFASLVFVPLNLWMADFHRTALATSDTPTPWDYLKIQSQVLVVYLRLSVWPHPLILDYAGWPPHPPLASVWPYAVGVLLLLGATVYGLFRLRPAAFVGAWCFLILAPTSSFLPLPTEVATERRMYLPLMGLVALVVCVGYRLLKRLAARSGHPRWVVGSVGGGLVALVAIAGAVRTVVRNEEYKTPLRVWQGVIARRPLNYRAYDNLGFEYLGMGDPASAKSAFLKASQINPADHIALNNLGNMYLREGNDADAEATLLSATRVKPDYASPYLNLGLLYFQQGKLGSSERLLRKAIALQPERADHFTKLAAVLTAQGSLAEAEAAVRKALQFDPASAATRDQLGLILARSGRTREALPEFRQAIDLDGSVPEYKVHLAWHLATIDDPAVRNLKAAFDWASQAVQQTSGQEYAAIDTLALTFAADGKFGDAAEAARYAVERAKAKKPGAVPRIEARRAAYAAGKMPEGDLLLFGR